MAGQLKPSPPASSVNTSKVMTANKAKGTKPELAVRTHLRSIGAKGYRLNFKAVAGSPDIAFIGKKIAIFVHGCFWHRCPKCTFDLPKSNVEFWQKKFELNIARDRRNIEALESLGWMVIVLWECEIKLHDFRKLDNLAYPQRDKAVIL